MKDVIDFLKGAVQRNNKYPSQLSCYNFTNGLVATRNEGMYAGVAMDSDVAFSVPAEEFEAVLSRIPQVTSLGYTGSVLTIKGGRLKAVIQCIDDDPFAPPPLPEDWAPAPAQLSAALRMALPFTSDQGWNSGIRLWDGRVTALSNTSAIDIQIEGLDVEEPISISHDAATFIIDQGNPDKFALDSGSISFMWGDGRWLKAQLLAAGFPTQVENIFEKAGYNAPVELTEEWRLAYADVAALADQVELTPHLIRSTRGAAQCEVEIETPLPEGYRSRWGTKVLDPAFACATHWAPAMYPDPVLFIGPSLRGAVVGFR